MPKRIQMTRQRPWRAENPDAVIVARPTRWGNPYRLAPGMHHTVVDRYGNEYSVAPGEDWRSVAVRHYREDVVTGRINPGDDPWFLTDGGELRGRDLACWCPLDQPCHADVLLELANGAPDA